MKKNTRIKLQNALTLGSFLLAGVCTGLWYIWRRQGMEVPIWLMGLLGYSWIFVAFLGINQVARKFSRRHPPVVLQKKEPVTGGEDDLHRP